MRASFWLAGTAVVGIASLPAIAQQAAQPTAPTQPAPATAPAPQPANPATAVQPGGEPVASSRPRQTPAAPAEGDSGVAELGADELPPPPPPIEMPDESRRDPRVVGRLDPADFGLATTPWGAANGPMLSVLLRRMDAPLASRWAHIALRNALLARAPAPRLVNPVDWVAERAWLLLRMGEADAARMLVSGVDVADFTPKMFQIAVQSALANGDAPGLCPLRDGLGKVEPKVAPMVDAMCASLSGEPESAAAQMESIRRRGRVGGIDLVLAEKVVGAGADTNRAVTVEWEPVQALNSWRFGLATATGMVPPERLINASSPQLRSWQARSPLLTAQQRLASARIAAGLGVFSSQALTDVYASIYDSTGPDELSDTDAWQLRVAYVGRDRDTRLSAMRRLWSLGGNSWDKEASRAVLGRAAARIAPSADLQGDAANLIASMLAAGLDRQAARWAAVVDDMDDAQADACWAMLALSAPQGVSVDVSNGRISSFIGRDNSPGKQRSALLVGALAGLGKISVDQLNDFNRRHGLRLERKTSWTQLIDAAADLDQGGTVLVLTGTGLQRQEWRDIPGLHLFHSVAALRKTGQDFSARMIAAEALART
ncbi:hypothetical protein G7077_02475 [Sphingomonas piscis]|uniref:Uncharacterized protein n=1 Tax=Sphingomonas piscis TaxID=2714943 RepID=A0A6G7YMK2_9SPHN|nr:hypothetical protein [Sphingomonas piscis]QIK77946.1 hypothetical protein G7077_02475 [Sphingomonas piscis]